MDNAAQDACSALEGAVIAGKYRLGNVLGQGGMGVVYVAEHLLLGEPVAMKFMHGEYAVVPEACARFVREARSQFRIKSDHVVQVLDVGEAESGAPFIVMELVQGGSVAELVERGPVEVATACEIVRQAAEGLASAHALGIVHRDVKPGNMLLATGAGGAMRVKLLDFGIAQVLEARGVDATRLTSTMAVIGTPSYMAPEQLRAARAADERSDVWSLGVVLYELLTGRLPYSAESPADLVLMQFAGPPQAASEVRASVPPALAKVVEQCLTFAASDRLPSAAALAAALATFARPVSAAALAFPRGARGATMGMGAEARDITFRRRKIMASSGGTAFVMHEPVRVGAQATALIYASSSSTTTARRRAAAGGPEPAWRRHLLPYGASVVAVALVAFGVALALEPSPPPPGLTTPGVRVEPAPVAPTATPLPAAAPEAAAASPMTAESARAAGHAPPASAPPSLAPAARRAAHPAASAAPVPPTPTPTPARETPLDPLNYRR